ncbi:CheR family methyltransferase [Paenibacillus mucilaginosus]|uniref:MCP methyltransferase, CheR-type n=2 Tax=Paenibacillus mucilaginosus TaxID=61624 RepID=H6NPU9_9BACL|nr:protein-glutamate O-methyltransferase CheR [Paenibacillus mucilaginosus]AEI45801.1 MCP methyltransferase, CheR-type [Paenibacillus mucilaginosus KNP414]AFC33455.1 MCP methyltransferase, CheR-type [Paenibacillus mucilaginosus 3016]MCG7215015.1 protein-glutamate O-methyltransferase CheR [Paenibacillus mucilaginosus]WDM27175.1 protein-glutamate O-methyltransferase CheR [Paenibacillus mucilaginosus]WFA21864.1 protein-glutamate O-methyltransferase CheR [Paenibacillus mucilaginosus]
MDDSRSPDVKGLLKRGAPSSEAGGAGRDEDERERIEITLLLEGLYRLYGYDFRNYAYASLRRRVWHRIHAEKLHTVSGLQERVLHDRDCMERLLSDLVIHVTEMFRDPSLFAAIREQVVPKLRELPAIRIWHAGCSTGEEVYSMAILLHEEGLYEKTRIYATDINEDVLQTAERASYPLKKMQDYTNNYIRSGGRDDFSKYYSSAGGTAVFHPFLRENVVFAQHNLVTDRSFNEFHLILCRNVLIYFDNYLQNQVHDLFYKSLSKQGYLVLGHKESISFTKHAARYETVNRQEKIFRMNDK